MSELALLIVDQAEKLLQYISNNRSREAFKMWFSSKDFGPEVEAMIIKEAFLQLVVPKKE